MWRKPSGDQAVQHPLADVAEGGVPQVVAQGDGLGQVLVEAQGAGDGPGHLLHLQGVGEPGPVVVAQRRHEHLGLVLEPAKGLAMEDPVPIPHEAGADLAGLDLPGPPPGIFGQGGIGRERLLLPGFPPGPYGILCHTRLQKSSLIIHIRRFCPFSFLFFVFLPNWPGKEKAGA